MVSLYFNKTWETVHLWVQARNSCIRVAKPDNIQIFQMHQTAIMDCSYMKHFAPPIFTNINKYRLHNFLILNASHLMCPVCLIHIHQSHQSFVHWSISQDTAATNFCSVTNGLICAWVGSIVTLLHKITSKLCLMCCLWTCQIESHAVSSSAALVSWYKMLPGRLRQHMFQISEQGSPQTSTNCQIYIKIPWTRFRACEASQKIEPSWKL